MSKTIVINEDDLRSLLAEGFHTAFRKATDCEEAWPIWKLIGKMPREDWGAVIGFVMSGITPYAAKAAGTPE
jgi:hypothetical protein